MAASLPDPSVFKSGERFRRLPGPDAEPALQRRKGEARRHHQEGQPIPAQDARRRLHLGAARGPQIQGRPGRVDRGDAGPRSPSASPRWPWPTSWPEYAGRSYRPAKASAERSSPRPEEAAMGLREWAKMAKSLGARQSANAVAQHAAGRPRHGPRPRPPIVVEPRDRRAQVGRKLNLRAFGRFRPGATQPTSHRGDFEFQSLVSATT